MANMHLVTGYAGQPHVTAADHGALNRAIFGDGDFVFGTVNMDTMKASIVNNNTIRVTGGEIMMQGRHARLDPEVNVDLTIENGEAGKSRIDLIVARYTRDTSTGIEEVNLAVIKGTATTSNPVAPQCTYGNIFGGNAAKHEMRLYYVYISGTNILRLESRFDRVLIGRDFASSVHNHDASDITSGILHEKFGGTGYASITDHPEIAAIRNIAEQARSLAQSAQSEIGRLWSAVNKLS